MKKLLIILIMLLLMGLTGVVLVKGISLGSFQVLGYNGIKQASQELDSKFEEANRLTSVTYNEKINNLKSATKDLQTARREYENKVEFSSPEEIEQATKTEQYEVEFLWTKIGGYAGKEGVTLKLEVMTGSAGGETKNLKFTVTGKYVGITDFIYDLEDDSRLAFKIENFSIKPAGESKSGQNTTLQAEFIVKNLNINMDAATTTTTTTTQESTNTNKGTSNNTVTSNTTNVENTNTTNTTT